MSIVMQNQALSFSEPEITGGVLLGREYRHQSQGGLRYRTESFVLDATGHEAAHVLKKYVLYEQLEQGTYPVGTIWVREEGDFLNNFAIIENE